MHDYRYQNVILQILRFVMDMYQGVLGTGHSTEVDSLVAEDIRKKLSSQIDETEQLLQLKGQIEMVEKMA